MQNHLMMAQHPLPLQVLINRKVCCQAGTRDAAAALQRARLRRIDAVAIVQHARLRRIVQGENVLISWGGGRDAPSPILKERGILFSKIEYS